MLDALEAKGGRLKAVVLALLAADSVITLRSAAAHDELITRTDAQASGRGRWAFEENVRGRKGGGKMAPSRD